MEVEVLISLMVKVTLLLIITLFCWDQQEYSTYTIIIDTYVST